MSPPGLSLFFPSVAWNCNGLKGRNAAKRKARGGLHVTGTILDLIDLRSFSNIWYWIVLVAVWSMATHWVLGVPQDVVARARRQGGQAAGELAVLLRVGIRRRMWVHAPFGHWLLGAACFAMTVLVLLGFVYRIEFAQAVVLLVGPMALVFALGQRLSRRIMALPEGAPEVHALLANHRALVQAIGGLSIFATTLWGMWQNLTFSVLGH